MIRSSERSRALGGFKQTRAWTMVIIVALLGQTAHAFTNMATGLHAAIGVAADPSGSAVYFVEWNTGALKRIALTPGCDATTPCPITTVAAGFSHPQDVALDIVHGAAYVTTRDDPGTTGAFWRVDLATGTRSLVTFNLGAPHQIALDIATDSAYVVGFDSGRLWKIELATGSKTTIMTGLGHPVGLALTADRTRAYVTEQTPPRLAEIDVALHARIRNVVTGLTSPFYLSWTDPAQIALYLVERSPTNDVLRVDLPTSLSAPAITGLPSQASAISLNALGGVAYISADASVVRADLATLPMGEPVFLSVGNVPSTSIVDGYATTPLAYFLQLKDSPFGGTLNIFGNFTNFKGLGATHYRVNVSKDGGAPVPLMQTWNATRWNPITSLYESAAIAPDAQGRYEIPSEYPSHPERWVPPFFMMRWPSGVNGMYTFTVEIFQFVSPATWNPLTALLPVPKNQLTVKIDMDPPDVDLVHLYQHGQAAPLDTCAIVTSPPFPAISRYDAQITANDPNGHLLSYSVTAYFGHTSPASTVIPTESYSSHVNADGLHLWRGVVNFRGPAAGWQATCNCAHTFFVDAWKRTTDGYGYLIHKNAHQSITIMNAGPTCP
jgi:DNA-binding beta-propeller fold protein YncE